MQRAEPRSGRPRPPRVSESVSLSGTAEELWQSLRRVATPRELAALLDVPYEHLVYLIYRSERSERYEHFEIPSRKGTSREIQSPNRSLKVLQRKVVQVLAASYEPSKIVHGFVRGQSIASNAAIHRGKRWVLSVDLRDFFGTITFPRVRGLFLAGPFDLPPAVATALANICCHDGKLPTGAPTSPIVSNLICRSLDRALERLARESGSEVTRFADDIAFSTNQVRLPPGLVEEPGPDTSGPVLGRRLVSVIEGARFDINKEKVRLMNRAARQTVTGVVVNSRLRPRRALRQKLEVLLFLWQRKGREEAEKYLAKHDASRSRRLREKRASLESVVEGRLAYWSMVSGPEDRKLASLATDFSKLITSSSFLKKMAKLETRVLGSLLVVESIQDGQPVQGTAFLMEGVGFVTCSHVAGSEIEVYPSLEPNRRVPASILAREEAVDLAVLSAEISLPFALRPSKSWVARLGQRVSVAGFPGHRGGDSGVFSTGHVTGFRQVSGSQRVLVGNGAVIAAGQSGGPALNQRGEVVGVCVEGSETMSTAAMTERHGIVPIRYLLDWLPSQVSP